MFIVNYDLLSDEDKYFIDVLHNRLQKREFLEPLSIQLDGYSRNYLWTRGSLYLFIKEDDSLVGHGTRIELSKENLSEMSEDELFQIWGECYN